MKYVHPTPKSMVLSSLLALAMHSVPALAQPEMSAEEQAIYNNMMKSIGLDPEEQMEAMEQHKKSEQWTDSDVIRYQIVGVYQGKPNVSSEPGKGSGFADVTDRVEIDLDWKLSESTMVGAPQFRNSKSTVTNPHDPEPSCLPPILKSEYEHYSLQGIKAGPGGALELQVQTTYPEVDVVQFCTGKRKSIPAASKTRPEALVVPSPVLLGMPLPDSDNLRISPDKKSMIHKNAGWTWTFTPRPHN